ncbi:GNAT family N-acetyltransferase [Phenylobacterium sp.]|uniref:GNAT family N-acetyltransferase n=1 Tax=Phenylobacterium sp. TaxID=1871053 RepID=UPI00286A859C|nr:GNAT family N-acetyltransferase [Phenylobacterium sp.]
MRPADLEALERATVEAVAPPEILEIGGWLVPLDDGAIGRAKSAAPLRHDLGPDALDEIEAAYRQRGLEPGFRVAEVEALEPLRTDLFRRGYAARQPTLFKTGPVSQLAMFSAASATILTKPDDAWAAIFVGEGFDPVDGASRVAALARSPDAIYAAAGEGGETQAVGVMTFGHGWAGIHGMRTAPSHRGRGLAGAILATLGRAAEARGVTRAFLQVEEANPARRIYRRAGFAPIWRYHYWR